MNVKLEKPKNISSYSWQVEYDKQEFEDFISQINYGVLTPGSTLFMLNKTISQNKIREAGFYITRSMDKADFVIITDVTKKGNYYRTYSKKNTPSIVFQNASHISDVIDSIENLLNKGFQCVLDSDLYKHLYKYTGNQELYNNLSELLNSDNSGNVNMAMEMMSNADWSGNEIYLQTLFNDYWYNYSRRSMKSNHYRQSISFKGFLESLDFNYTNLRLSSADDYRNLCITQEHHDWVFAKFGSEFKDKVEQLAKEYKLIIDKLEYSIDKNLKQEEQVDEY